MNASNGDPHDDDLDRPALHWRARARHHGSVGADVVGRHRRVACGRCMARSHRPGDDHHARHRLRAACAGAHAQAAAPCADHTPRTVDVPQDHAGDVANGARRHRSRHRLVGCRTLLRPPRLEAPALFTTAASVAGRTSLPRRGNREALRPRQRLGDHADLAGHVARGVGLCQAGGLPGHDHPEGIRRQRFLGLCALAGHHEAVDALLRGGRVGHGAQLAGPGRAAAALRHRSAEEPLPAAPRPWRRNPLLCADQRVCGLRRRCHSRCGGGLPWHARGPRNAGLPCDLEQALHHARADCDGAGLGLPRGRSGWPAR